MMRRAYQRARQGKHAALVVAIRFALQFLHCFSNFERGGCRRHGLAEAYRHGVRNLARHLPNEAPALVTEDAAPHAVDILHDAFHAAAEGKQLADARDLSFGKDADDFTVAYRVASFAQRVNHVTWTKLRGNRNCANQFGEGLDVRLFVDVLEDEEADRTVNGGEEQQRIN